MTVTARPATASDAPALASVAALTFPLACPPGTALVDMARFVTTVLSEERFDDYLADPTRHVLALEDDAPAPGAPLPGSALPGAPLLGAPLRGYAMLVTGDPADADVAAAVEVRPTVELSKLYVAPDAHGQGAARVLMEAALATARATGASSIWLGVNQQNSRAQAFYAKHGFERVGTKRFTVGTETHDDFVLARGL
ncbi:GNAT family N-acetyltransferase [Frigoribacterium sp. PvP032]|uniref:GNAT family N-acetyltransferase n=1 Tax=Frigoribacterium sp. PvP032 TaxID=2806589 RepID=UPI001AE51187|nr:GNAT family N-acetyltransferase [Frigoribacterium sp. PvP032]MBP1190095.1 ribosomal protein S18 acetylase RimI-like enzyme [Frigoribacterium sp. PvP032]